MTDKEKQISISRKQSEHDTRALMFNIQFKNYSEVLAWVKNRAEITGDEVLKGLVAAL